MRIILHLLKRTSSFGVQRTHKDFLSPSYFWRFFGDAQSGTSMNMIMMSQSGNMMYDQKQNPILKLVFMLDKAHVGVLQRRSEELKRLCDAKQLKPAFCRKASCTRCT